MNGVPVLFGMQQPINMYDNNIPQLQTSTQLNHNHNVQMDMMIQAILHRLEVTRQHALKQRLAQQEHDRLMRCSQLQSARSTDSQSTQLQQTHTDCTNTSHGFGDWRSQLSHVYGQLNEVVQTDTLFRQQFAEPQLGQLNQVDIEETDDQIQFVLSFAKPGRSNIAGKIETECSRVDETQTQT